MKIVDTILKIQAESMPPKADFIEEKIKHFGIEPIRWAIIEINNDELTLSVAGIVR